METIHLFIVNPVAGKKDMSGDISRKAKNLGIKNCFIEITKGKSDASSLAEKWVKENLDKFIRIYACGGDGTINEVNNGVYKYKDCSVGGIPIGTGNDFLRTLEELPRNDFLQLDKVIKGT